MPDDRQFWDWFKQNYGEDLYNQYFSSYTRITHRIPDQLKEHYQFWQTNVAPKPELKLTEDEIKDYEALAQTHLERQVAEGKITYDQYKEELAKVQAEVDAGIVSKQSSYYQEAINLAPDWAYKIQQQQIKQQQAEQEKQKRFEQTELAKQEAQFETEKAKGEALAGRQEAEARPELLAEQGATRIPRPDLEFTPTIPILEAIKKEPSWYKIYQRAKQFGVDTSELESTQYQPGVSGEGGIQSSLSALLPQITVKEQEWERLKKEAKVTPMSRNRPQRIARI